MGRAPAPFSQYCYPLLRFSRENRFTYHISRLARERRAARRLGATGGRAETYADAAMMDIVLEAWVAALIELNKLEWMLGVGEPGSRAKS